MYALIAVVCAGLAVAGIAIYVVFAQTAASRQENFCLLAQQSIVNASQAGAGVDPALVAIVQGLGCPIPAPVLVDPSAP
jgi:hypothetical protein